MKLKVPFRIGYQYGNWELNLMSIADSIPDNSYCSYLWVGSEIKKFLNFIPHRTELIFYWDILEVVILEFDKKSESYYNRINKSLSDRVERVNLEILPDGMIIHKFITRKVIYWSIYFPVSKEIRLIYFSNSFAYTKTLLE
ncbi:hypothetical protein QWZ06_00065 [Chryseobacterium tructae]|uniref:Uncharacterized protein n=1 Tax=Chryseobacterium tructae TaxID=1037380 RepID=A0ABV7XS49_9FLAO|nr:hypothetical protein [Chryseobacterium tructae]MDN3690776.1 hypothetical protein [Chryseobacterium tructae]